LHDIGKVGVPDKILMKQTPLSRLERMVMEQVPLIGTRIVDHMRILESEVQIIRHQREHFDGSGIPAGLAGKQIPIGARILLVGDAFDAMTTDRVYRERRPIDDAVDELKQLSGTQFDPQAVAALLQILESNRPAWEQRINETIEVMHMPSEGRIDLAANKFLPADV
jgi:HD-GYP domain-containing protein (c-di-GMP phosphodiesterase class II)